MAQIRCRNHLASSNGNAVQAQAACTGQAVNAHALQALAGIGILKLEVRCFECIGVVFDDGAGLVGAVRRGVATHGNDDGGGVAGAVRVGQGVGDLYRAGHVRRRGEHQFAVGINDDVALTRVFQFRFANGQLAVVVVSVFVVGLHVDGHRGVDGGAGGVVVRLRRVVHRGHVQGDGVRLAIKGTGAVLDAEGEAGVRAAVAVFGRGEHQLAQIRCRNLLAGANRNAVQAQAA